MSVPALYICPNARYYYVPNIYPKAERAPLSPTGGFGFILVKAKVTGE